MATKKKTTGRANPSRRRSNPSMSKQAKGALTDAVYLAGGTISARLAGEALERTVLANQTYTTRQLVAAGATGALGVALITKGKRGSAMAGVGQGMVLNAVMQGGEAIVSKLRGMTAGDGGADGGAALGRPYSPRRIPASRPANNAVQRAVMRDAVLV